MQTLKYLLSVSLQKSFLTPSLDSSLYFCIGRRLSFLLAQGAALDPPVLVLS